MNAVGQSPEPAPQVASVEWVDRPADVGELAEEARAVVEAEVVGIEAGTPLLNAADAAKPDEAIPTQRISFRTLSLLEGQMPETFRLFKTGSADVYLEGDPLYELGETYVLFVEPRQGEPGTYVPTAPDGRLVVDERGEAEAFIEGGAAEDLEGQTPEEIEAAVSGG